MVSRSDSDSSALEVENYRLKSTLTATIYATRRISLVDETILIPFKARAFLDLSGRKANGEDVDAGQR